MAVNLSPIGGVAAQFFDNSGNILSGGKIYTYTAGTTTPQTTYTSSSGVTAHSNPIILDAAGRVPSGEIWLTDGLQYKFLIKTSTDVQIGSYDNISGINSNFVNYTTSQEFQTATAGQTVFTLTTMVYQPGTGSLSVFVDGVNQYGPGALYAYQETSDTVVTFTTGLHVGADVKFTTSVINASSYGDAQQISYIPPFTNSVVTNVEAKLAQTVSVMDFGAVGNGIADDTAEIQAAINYAVGESKIVFMPAGTYLVTDTLNIPMYTQIKGEHSYQNGKGYGVEPRGTKISFQPTTPKTLFQASGAKPLGGFYRSSYLLDGLYLSGNSIDATGNSIYGIDVDSITYSTFRNITIDGFRTGIRVYFTINNRFENIHIANAFIQDVLYAGGTATTDVWTQCTFHSAPVGVTFTDVSLGVRFTDCLFEGLENYGVNISKESFAITFVNCYAEDVPSTNNANGAMFRVGYDGTTLTVSNALTVIGGYYGGRNAGGVGSFVDADYVSGAMITSPIVNRYTNGVKTSANTAVDCVVMAGMQSLSVTTNYTDLTKINGLFISGQTGIAGAEQQLRTPVIYTDQIYASRAAPNKNIVIGADDAAIFLGTTSGQVGFYSTTPIAKPTITGSRGGNAALANLLTQLAALGLITNSTT